MGRGSNDEALNVVADADVGDEVDVGAAASVDRSVTQSSFTKEMLEEIRHRALAKSGTMVKDSKPYREFDGGKIRVWGYLYDKQAVEQIRRVANYGWAERAVLCADNHLGYSQPIGGVVAYREMISPSGVGYDLSCGVYGVRTNLRYKDIASDVERIADEMARRISFGVGRKNPTPVDHELFDSPIWERVPYLTQKLESKRGSYTLRDRAAQQLGTTGGGNHWVNVFVEPETGVVWIGCHFGSRGFGHGIASGFLNLAQGKPFSTHAPEGESMHALPTLLPLTPDAAQELNGRDIDPSWAVETGQQYKSCLELASQFAHAGREYVVSQVLDILGAKGGFEVHNDHNLSWTETFDGEEFEVVRKGATPAYPGQLGLVGGSMADISVIVRGVDTENAEKALRSTVHGAGRVMSRSRAKGNRKGTRAGEISPEMMFGALASFRQEMDVPLVVRGGDVDESPFVYRKLESVLDAHVNTETIEVAHTLVPVAVCMAPSDVVDPFKD